MIKYLADRITDYFIKEEIISIEEKNIYRYGSEVTISTILGISLIILIGLLSGQVSGSILFLLCFIPTRVYTGGYHADTYLECNLSFCAIFIVYLAVKNNIPARFDFFISITLIAVSLIIISVLSPVENKYKPLCEKEKIKYKVISIIISSGLSILAVISYMLKIGIYTSISLTLFFIAILMIAEKINIKKKGY